MVNVILTTIAIGLAFLDVAFSVKKRGRYVGLVAIASSSIAMYIYGNEGLYFPMVSAFYYASLGLLMVFQNKKQETHVPVKTMLIRSAIVLSAGIAFTTYAEGLSWSIESVVGFIISCAGVLAMYWTTLFNRLQFRAWQVETGLSVVLGLMSGTWEMTLKNIVFFFGYEKAIRTWRKEGSNEIGKTN